MHSLLSQGLAGIQPVDIPGVENVRSFHPMCNSTVLNCYDVLLEGAISFVALQVDVTQLIEGHSCYLRMTRKILEQLELDNYNSVFRSEHENPQEEKSTAN